MPKVVPDDKIFAITIQMVIARGYAGATTRQIAEEARISEVTLFRKYGNKATLVKKAMLFTASQSGFESAARYTGELTADLLRIVKAYRGLTEKTSLFFPTLLSEVPRYPELSDVLDTPIEMMRRVADVFVRYQREGLLAEEHPLHAVAALLGPLSITAMVRGSFSGNLFPPIDIEQHVKMFLQGRLHSTQK